MAYSSFPVYAQFLLDSYEVRTTTNMLRDEMEDGYVNQAPGNSLTRHELPVAYRLPSVAEKEAFDTWCKVTLRRGALYFEWPEPSDPLGVKKRRARIVKGEVTYKPLTTRLDDWQATFVLEYWA